MDQNRSLVLIRITYSGIKVFYHMQNRVDHHSVFILKCGETHLILSGENLSQSIVPHEEQDRSPLWFIFSNGEKPITAYKHMHIFSNGVNPITCT